MTNLFQRIAKPDEIRQAFVFFLQHIQLLHDSCGSCGQFQPSSFHFVDFLLQLRFHLFPLPGTGQNADEALCIFLAGYTAQHAVSEYAALIQI